MSIKTYNPEIIEEIKKQLTQGNYRNIYFGDYLVYWLEELYAPRVVNSSYVLATHTVYKWILPQLQPDVKLSLLSAEYLNAILKQTSTICKSAPNKSYEIINWAINDAMLYGFVQQDLMINVQKYRRENGSVYILNRDNLRRFLLAAYDTNWYLEILLGVFCGLRKGEILGLQFTSIKENYSVVEVNKQLTLNKKVEKGNGEIQSCSYVLREPKTENSVRAIRVPKYVQGELKKRKAAYDKAKKLLGKDFLDDKFVSFQPTGAPHTTASFNTALNRLCMRNGLPRITPHSLRHMYATILLEQKVPLAKISALLGHSSINTTFDYYCEQMDENNKIIDFMNESFKAGVYNAKD